MRRLLALIALPLFALGCHAGAQQPPSPPVLSCPPATYPGSNYTEVNPPASTTVAASINATTYIFSPPSVGSWCAIIQSWGNAAPTGQPAAYQVSVPSNVVLVTTTAALPQITYNWQPIAQNAIYSSYTFIVSYVAAISAPLPSAPVQGAPQAVAQVIDPNAPPAPVVMARSVPMRVR